MITPSPSGSQPDLPTSPDRPPVGRLMAGSLLIVALFFGGLGTWAALSPLESAAIAPGRITVASNRKTVQHLEGGIVRAIEVEEGDQVQQGQVIVRLEDTRTRATADLLRSRKDHLMGTHARLRAERDGRERITFPKALTSRRRQPEVQSILEGEIAIFEARSQALNGGIDIYQKRIRQLEKEIASLEAKVAATSRQLELLEDEHRRYKSLVDQGLMAVIQLFEVERRVAGLQGDRGEAEALIARAEQRIGEANLLIINLQNNIRKEVANGLKETQAELADVGERLKQAEDILQRTGITAPQSGTVVGLKIHTSGGVIEPGQPIMDIVPQDDLLLVEARIQPIDIDVVHPGLDAQVRLSAFKQRNTPVLDGVVERVSADSFTDPSTGLAYYLARVVINPEQRVEVEDLELYPGMPAQVMILTGKQTALDYVIAPIKDSFTLAFR